jgi:2-haloacid dehalogenase
MATKKTRRNFIEAVGAAATAAAAAPSVAIRADGQSPPSGRISVLAFDAYGTLFDVFSVTALCEELFPGLGSALAQLWRIKQLQYTQLRSVMGRHRDFWRVTEDALVYAARSIRLDLTPDKRRRLLDAYLTLAAFPDVRPGLESLRRSGLRLAILSNGEPKMLAATVKSAGIADLFHTVLSAEDVQVFKPSPRVYWLISERMKVDRGSVGFVSSNSWDVVGAGSAGLQTFWVQRSAEPREELGFPPTYVVKTITELPAIIERTTKV